MADSIGPVTGGRSRYFRRETRPCVGVAKKNSTRENASPGLTTRAGPGDRVATINEGIRSCNPNQRNFFALEDDGLFEDSRHGPGLRLGDGTRFSDFNLVAFLAADFVVSVILLALDDVLAVEGGA